MAEHTSTSNSPAEPRPAEPRQQNRDQQSTTEQKKSRKNNENSKLRPFASDLFIKTSFGRTHSLAELSTEFGRTTIAGFPNLQQKLCLLGCHCAVNINGLKSSAERTKTVRPNYYKVRPNFIKCSAELLPKIFFCPRFSQKCNPASRFHPIILI